MEPHISAFGPEGRFFAQCPGSLSNDGDPHRWGNDLPADLQPIVTAHSSVAVAFGTENSWICVYYDSPNTCKLALSTNREGLPEELISWLQELETDRDSTKLGNVKICLGPDGMFFASSGYAFRYGGWPKPLDFLLKRHLDYRDMKSFPTIVQIVDLKRIVIVGEKGDHTTILGQELGHLSGVIRGLNTEAVHEDEAKKIEFLYLDSFNPGNFVLVSRTSDSVYEMFYHMPAPLQSSAEACKNKLDGRPQILRKIQLDEDVALTRDEIIEVLGHFVDEIAKKDKSIAEYDEILKLYDERLDTTTAALEETNATIVKYEALIEEMRTHQQNDSFAAARAIREANAQANADFIVRQRAQNLQYQSQMVATTMQNMNTQRNVAVQNIMTTFSNSMADIGRF